MLDASSFSGVQGGYGWLLLLLAVVVGIAVVRRLLRLAVIVGLVALAMLAWRSGVLTT